MGMVKAKNTCTKVAIYIFLRKFAIKPSDRPTAVLPKYYFINKKQIL